jgi:bla regulator protein blaR1
MNPILLYILKAAGSFTLFYLCYRFILSSDTYFTRNRFYLLGSIVISMFAPLIKITVKTIEMPIYTDISVQTHYINESVKTPEVNNIWPLIINWILIIYLSGIFISLIRITWAYFSTFRIIFKSERKKFQHFILALSHQAFSPFSFFQWLVIPKNKINHPDFNHIVQHESIHSRQYHSADLFLAEIMVMLQWFNPFVWMLKKAIIENHEYIVDQTLLYHGINVQQYQYSLLNNVMDKSGHLSVANHFNSNLLKKRIRMMNKNQSPKWHRIKNLIILLVTTLVVYTTGSFETKIIAQTAPNEPLIVINNKSKTLNDLQKINPSSIEKVEVLKDSAAKILYGTKGKNGVILITLKDSLKMKTEIVQHLTINMDSLGIKNIFEKIGNKDSAISKIIVIKKNAQKPIIIINGVKLDSSDIIKDPLHIQDLDILKEDPEINVTKGEGDKEFFITYTSSGKNSGDSLKVIKIKKSSNMQTSNVVYVVDGKESTFADVENIDPSDILKVNVVKDTKIKSGKKGAVEITTKSAQKGGKNFSFSVSADTDNDMININISDDNKKQKYTVQLANKKGDVLYKTDTSEKNIAIPVAKYNEDSYQITITSEDKKTNCSASVTIKH